MVEAIFINLPAGWNDSDVYMYHFLVDIWALLPNIFAIATSVSPLPVLCVLNYWFSCFCELERQVCIMRCILWIM